MYENGGFVMKTFMASINKLKAGGYRKRPFGKYVYEKIPKYINELTKNIQIHIKIYDKV